MTKSDERGREMPDFIDPQADLPLDCLNGGEGTYAVSYKPDQLSEELIERRMRNFKKKK